MDHKFNYVVDEHQPYIDMIRRLWCYGTIKILKNKIEILRKDLQC